MILRSRRAFTVVGGVCGSVAGVLGTLAACWHNDPVHFARSPAIGAATAFTLAVAFFFPLEYARQKHFPDPRAELRDMAPFDIAIFGALWRGGKIAFFCCCVVALRFLILRTWLHIL